MFPLLKKHSFMIVMLISITLCLTSLAQEQANVEQSPAEEISRVVTVGGKLLIREKILLPVVKQPYEPPDSAGTTYVWRDDKLVPMFKTYVGELPTEYKDKIKSLVPSIDTVYVTAAKGEYKLIDIHRRFLGSLVIVKGKAGNLKVRLAVAMWPDSRQTSNYVYDEKSKSFILDNRFYLAADDEEVKVDFAKTKSELVSQVDEVYVRRYEKTGEILGYYLFDVHNRFLAIGSPKDSWNIALDSTTSSYYEYDKDTDTYKLKSFFFVVEDEEAQRVKTEFAKTKSELSSQVDKVYVHSIPEKGTSGYYLYDINYRFLASTELKNGGIFKEWSIAFGPGSESASIYSYNEQSGQFEEIGEEWEEGKYTYRRIYKGRQK